MADLGEILIGLIPVAFGFALGFLLRPVEQRLSNRKIRKRLAAVLCSEVESIRAMAESSLTINTPSVEGARRGLRQDAKSLGGIEIDDVDYPSRAYDSHLSQIDLFSNELVVSLDELYRWIGYAHHWKRVNLRFGGEVNDMFSSFAARGGFSNPEKDLLTYKTGATVHYAEQYLKVQRRVLELATHTVNELKTISKAQVEGKVSVTTGEVMRETFPKR